MKSIAKNDWERKRRKLPIIMIKMFVCNRHVSSDVATTFEEKRGREERKEKEKREEG